MVLTSATWRPNTFSSASEISPTVAPARAARIENSSRLPRPLAASVSAANAVSTAATSRVPLSACTNQPNRDFEQVTPALGNHQKHHQHGLDGGDVTGSLKHLQLGVLARPH